MVWFLQDQDPLLSGAPFKGRLMSLEGGTYGGFPIKFLVLVVRHGLCLCCLCTWATHCRPVYPLFLLVWTCTSASCTHCCGPVHVLAVHIVVDLDTHHFYWCGPVCPLFSLVWTVCPLFSLVWTVCPLFSLVWTCVSTVFIGVDLCVHCFHWCRLCVHCSLFSLVWTVCPLFSLV